MTNTTPDKSYYKYEGKLPHFRNPQETFENAIEKGIFSEMEVFKKKPPEGKQEKFVGNWMYMHSDNIKEIDFFKNKLTRKYMEVSYGSNNDDDLANQCIEKIINWLNENIDCENYPTNDTVAEDSANLKEKIDLFMEGVDEF